MPDLAAAFPLILATHVTLAIALFVPSLLLPFTLRARPMGAVGAPAEPGRVVATLLWLQAHGTVLIGAGLALTGVAMVAVLGPRIVEQPWLVVSLVTYAVTAVVAFVIQRPTLRRLLHADRVESDADRDAWRAGARRQRYVAYAITSAVGFIAFMMSTKPELW